MAEATNGTFAWPMASWEIQKRIIRAWYAAEEGGGEFTQRKIASLAKMQPSRLSVNKPFLQSVGIVAAKDITLTEAGRSYGLGLYKENERVQQQGLQKIIRQCSLLKQLLDIIRGRGVVEKGDFEAEVTLLTKQGSSRPGFTIGLGVLQVMLIESGWIGVSGDTLRPVRDETGESNVNPEKREDSSLPIERNIPIGLRRIPIPVSASSVWYIEVAENAEGGEVEKFIEMQKLIFATK